jgi:DNA polymerase-3 subunit chi
MPSVDFYILEQASGLKSLHYACLLIEKAHQQDQRVYIHTNSPEDAERIDMLLWTYRDDSFLPHSIYDAADENSPPIRIGFDKGYAASGNDHVLVNLDKEIPSFFHKFNRIIEIVFSDPTVQQLARERFKKYRDQGCEMNTYKIKASEL